MLNNQRLVERLLRRRQGPVPGMRSMMIIGGGAMRGVYGAGVVLALHQLGLGQVFDIVIGISTGAPTGAYFLGGPLQTQLGASVYYEECPRDFIRWSRVHRPLDFTILINTFRIGLKAMDTKAITASPTELHVVVTNATTGQTEFLNAKTVQPDFFAAINASMAMPSLSPPVNVNGQTYIDGDIDPLPGKLIIDYFKPTDVFIVPNRDERAFRRWQSRLVDVGLGVTTLKHRNLGMTQRALTRSQRYWNGIRYCLDQPDLTTGIIWPPRQHPISIFTTDADRLKGACRQAAQETLQMFGRPDLGPELM